MSRTFPLWVSLAAAMLLAAGVAVVATLEPAQAAFPGKNGKIVFSHRDNIYSISPSGNDLERLTSDNPQRPFPAENRNPSWSADGNRIVFSRYDGGNFYQFDIYTMNADGSNRRQVINERSIPGRGTDDYAGTFSPSGRGIVFARGAEGYGGGSALYKIDTDGSNLALLTERYFGNVFAPAWSPDGSQIAFGRDPMGLWHYAIYVMVSDGSNIRRITDNRGIDMRPDWSPDGSQIVYARAGEIFKMNAEGAKVTQVTHNRSYDSDPAFSPGGGKIVFLSNRDGDADIYIMDADGTHVRQVTDSPGPDWQPDWQPVQ